MQQSPFPIAHGNQSFQGRWTDGKRVFDCCKSLITCLVNTLMGFLCISTAGMDASAQTGSHELTIPNDVSGIYLLLRFISCCPVFLLFTLWDWRCWCVLTVSSGFSSLVASLVVRAQRSMRSVRCQVLRSRSLTPWRAQLTDRSPSLAPTPASAWLSTWLMLGKKEAVGFCDASFQKQIVECSTFCLLCLEWKWTSSVQRVHWTPASVYASPSVIATTRDIIL